MSIDFIGGDEGNRTPDLYVANVPLSHLSYIPTVITKILQHINNKEPLMKTNLCYPYKLMECWNNGILVM